MQHFIQPGVSGAVGGEMGAIYLPKRGDKRVSMFPCDLTIPVTVAVVQAGLFHSLFSCKGCLGCRAPGSVNGVYLATLRPGFATNCVQNEVIEANVTQRWDEPRSALGIASGR
jgi:hypothetical protein